MSSLPRIVLPYGTHLPRKAKLPPTAASLRFAKIKYILNGLSAGHDVVFLDTDIIVLQDPLPYFLGRGADMWGSMEKCMIYPDRMSFHSTEFQVRGAELCR